MTNNSQDEVARCFASLPPNIQESIKQSGLCFSTEAELRACAAQLLGQNTSPTS